MFVNLQSYGSDGFFYFFGLGVVMEKVGEIMFSGFRTETYSLSHTGSYTTHAKVRAIGDMLQLLNIHTQVVHGDSNPATAASN